MVRGRKEAANRESLTMREVRESPAKDMGEALKQVEGVNILRKGAIASDVVLRVPFASGMKVPENGRNFYITCAYRL